MKENSVTKGDTVVAMFEDGSMLSLGQGWKSQEEVEEYLDAEYPNRTGDTRLFVDEWVYSRPHAEPHSGMTEYDMDMLAEAESILSHSDMIDSVWRPQPSTSETVSYRGGEEIHSTAADWDLCVTIREVSDIDRHVANTLGAEPVDAYAASTVQQVLDNEETDAELEIVGAKKHDTDDRRRFMISAYFRLHRENDDTNIVLRQCLQKHEDVQSAYLPSERVHNWSGWIGTEPDKEDTTVYIRLNKEKEPNEDNDYEKTFGGNTFGPFSEAEITSQVENIIDDGTNSEHIDTDVEIVGVGQVMTRFKGNFVPMAALHTVD